MRGKGKRGTKERLREWVRKMGQITVGLADKTSTGGGKLLMP